MMRRTLIIATLLIALALPFFMHEAGKVSAQVDPLDSVCDSETASASVCNSNGSNPISGERGIIMRVVQILSYVIGVASVIMIMIGGLKFITSNGDSNSVASARNTVLYSLIGVAVFLSSQLIIRFVISRL